MKLVQTSLTYQIAPHDETGAELRPALVLLHGRGADEHDLLGLVPYLDPRFICIAPRAPFSFPYGGFTWYDLEDIGQANESQFIESYDRLIRFLDDVQNYHPVDPQRLFLLGFSMGTVMSYAASLTQPERFKGVVAHSGYLPELRTLKFQWPAAARTRYFIAHGTEDPVIPVEFARKVRQIFTEHKVPFEYREYPFQHQISEVSLSDLSEWLRTQLDSQ